MRELLDQGVDPGDFEVKDNDAELWNKVHAAWLKADKKCACGQPITLDDAFHIGCCADCDDETDQLIQAAQEFMADLAGEAQP